MRASGTVEGVVEAEKRTSFIAGVIPSSLTADAANVMRQALAGMLWSKQFYYYDVDKWLTERGADPFRPMRRRAPRNEHRDDVGVVDVMPGRIRSASSPRSYARLGAIVAELGSSSTVGSARPPAQLILATVTIVMSWAFTRTTSTRRTAARAAASPFPAERSLTTGTLSTSRS